MGTFLIELNVYHWIHDAYNISFVHPGFYLFINDSFNNIAYKLPHTVGSICTTDGCWTNMIQLLITQIIQGYFNDIAPMAVNQSWKIE